MVAAPCTQTGRNRPVCVLTRDTDPTADTVVRELERREVPVLRFDLADFPQQVRLDARFDPPRGGWTGILRAHGREVRLEEIGAMWWWHPGAARVAEHLEAAQARWLARESNAGLAGVLASLDCLHLNHPTAIGTAQCKPLALAAAARAGLSVPATWIGNTPRDATAFAETAGPLVCKALTVPGIDQHTLFLPTTRVDPAMLEAVTGAAHQLQHLIDKAFEVRLTVVGSQMFAARITTHSAADSAAVDYRADYNATSYTTLQVPDPLAEAVRAWLRDLGLGYAAIDLLVDHEGRWWAIDLNPCGQYGWIQHHLPQLPISSAIAAALTVPHRFPAATTTRERAPHA